MNPPVNFGHLSVGPLMQLNVPKFFECLWHEIVEASKTERKCVYLELGIMSAETLLGACQLLSKGPVPWAAYGVDLNGGPWIKSDEIPKQIPNLSNKIGSFLTTLDDGSNPESPCRHDSGCGIYLTGTEAFLNRTSEMFDFVFIDACHEYDCCRRDFEMVESKVRIGGIVVFHDSEPDIQGGDIQPHNKQPIEVRKVLSDTGLLQNTRPGWRLLCDLIHPFNTDRGCVFVIKEELVNTK